jgi:hypothetical protein
LQARWPGVAIQLRADSGCVVPAPYTFCEPETATYTIGLIPNARLEALAAPYLVQAHALHVATDEKMRLVDETAYQAGRWTHSRHLVYKTEAHTQGLVMRFVATTRSDPTPALLTASWFVAVGSQIGTICMDIGTAC